MIASDTSGRLASAGARLLRLSVSAALALAFLTALERPAAASRIHASTHGARDSAASSRLAWSRFLAGGPDLWAVTPSPRFPSGARLPIVAGGLIQTPFVDYLLWRRSLNPARFDAYHPNVARVFAQLTPLPDVQPGAIVSPTTTTPEPTPAVTPAAQEIVPEPGSLAISATLAAGAILWCRRRIR